MPYMTALELCDEDTGLAETGLTVRLRNRVTDLTYSLTELGTSGKYGKATDGNVPEGRYYVEVYDGGLEEWVPRGGFYTHAGPVEAVHLLGHGNSGNGKVSHNDLMQNAVSEGKIQAGAVTGPKVAPNAIDDSHIDDLALPSKKLQQWVFHDIDVATGTIATPETVDFATDLSEDVRGNVIPSSFTNKPLVRIEDRSAERVVVVSYVTDVNGKFTGIELGRTPASATATVNIIIEEGAPYVEPVEA